MRILITGGNGFVGRHVIAALGSDYDIISPRSDRLHLVNPTGLPLDLGNGSGTFQFSGPFAVAEYMVQNQVEAVIHLAATVAGLPGNMGNQGRFMYENLQMSMNVFEGARLASVNKIINLGSVCGYHDVGPKPFKEENYWTGLPHESNRGYGMAKRASIMLGIEYEHQYGIDVTNLVPINLVGEYDRSDHVCVDLIRKFEEADGKPVTLWGAGKATREFCYAGDLADAIVLSLKIKTGAWPINIGTGQEISIEDLSILIKTIGGYKSEILWDATKPEGQFSRCLDISRAKSILGWAPKTSLREALQRAIQWYRDGQI